MDWGQVISDAIRAGIGADAVIYALAAIGLNVHFGFTGLLNFGQVAFLAMGAYAVAVGVNTYGLSLGLCLFLGLLAAVVLGLVLGVPTLRLRSDYLAIVTIASGEVIRLVFRAATFRDTLGGSDGLQRFGDAFYSINPYDGDVAIWRIKFGAQDLWSVTVGWVLVVLAALLVMLLMRSPWGRVLKAIREDEDAVRSLGKNVYSYKMQSLLLGGLIGAFAGMLFALDRQAVQPDNYSTALTFTAYAVLILGGTATIWGPVLGAMVYWFVLQGVDSGLRQAIDSGAINLLQGNEVGIVKNILAGVILMLLVIFRPQGLIGDKREVAVSVRR